MKRLQNIISGLTNSIRNFPLAMLLFAILSILMIITNHEFADVKNSVYQNLFIVFCLVLPAIVAIYIGNFKAYIRILLHLVVLILGVVDFIYLKSIGGVEKLLLVQGLYQIMFFAISMISIFVAYYFRDKNDQKLWYIDNKIIGSFAVSLLFILVINLGIAGIFGSLDYLFNLDVNWKYFWDISAIVNFVIGGSIFLNNIIELETTQNHYSKFMYILAKYILLGLLAIYTIIFLAYGVKILVTGTWPEGQVVYMTIGYFVLGILANVLLYPVSNDESWIPKIYNIFYIVSLPILVLGFMAIYLRIDDYGVTINRYFVILIFLFAAIFCIYNIFIKNKKIIGLLLSSFILLLVSLLPVIGFEDISYNSQAFRFDNLIKKSKALDKDNKIISGYVWTGDIANQLYEQITYFRDYKSIDYVKPYLTTSQFDIVNSKKDNYDRNEKIREYIMSGYVYSYSYNYDDNNKCNSIYINSNYEGKEFDIADYNKFININFYSYNENIDEARVINFTKTGFIFNNSGNNIYIDLSSIINSTYTETCNSQSILNPVIGSNYKFYIINAGADYNSGDIKLTSLEGMLFVK